MSVRRIPIKDLRCVLAAPRLDVDKLRGEFLALAEEFTTRLTRSAHLFDPRFHPAIANLWQWRRRIADGVGPAPEIERPNPGMGLDLDTGDFYIAGRLH